MRGDPKDGEAEIRGQVHRRAVLGAVALAPALAGQAQAQAQAQAVPWPDRPVRVIVPFAPGGGVDLVGRVVAEALQPRLGQPVVVENRAGGGSAIGIEMLSRAAPDGHTLGITGGSSITIGPLTRPSNYDPMGLTHVSRLSMGPLLLVCRNDFPAADLTGFEAVARAGRNLSFATGGVGTNTQMAAELLNQRLGGGMAIVPYRGTAPALQDVASGNVDLFLTDMSGLAVIQQGAVRLLATSTARPWPSLPDTPPISRILPDFDVAVWYGLAAPGGLPPAIRARLETEVAVVLELPQVQARIRAIGFEPSPLASAPFTDFIRREIATWREVIERQPQAARP